jgi:hypothetical protein
MSEAQVESAWEMYEKEASLVRALAAKSKVATVEEKLSHVASLYERLAHLVRKAESYTVTELSATHPLLN